eukprot:scaffold3587_cov364-Prasinococcus_capsulatus_cf.AAC.12
MCLPLRSGPEPAEREVEAYTQLAHMHAFWRALERKEYRGAVNELSCLPLPLELFRVEACLAALERLSSQVLDVLPQGKAYSRKGSSLRATLRALLSCTCSVPGKPLVLCVPVVWSAANALKALVDDASAKQARQLRQEVHEEPKAITAQLQALCTFAVRADRKLRLPPSKLEQLAAWMTLA